VTDANPWTGWRVEAIDVCGAGPQPVIRFQKHATHNALLVVVLADRVRRWLYGAMRRTVLNVGRGFGGHEFHGWAYRDHKASNLSAHIVLRRISDPHSPEETGYREFGLPESGSWEPMLVSVAGWSPSDVCKHNVMMLAAPPLGDDGPLVVLEPERMDDEFLRQLAKYPGQAVLITGTDCDWPDHCSLMVDERPRE
jgi:hypothetical protein